MPRPNNAARRAANDKLLQEGARQFESLLTPDEFLQKMFDMLPGKKDEETLTYGELKALVSQSMLPGGGHSHNNIKFAVKVRIEEYAYNNPTGQGIAAANIWKDLTAKYPMRLEGVELALKELLEAGEITVTADQVPGYLPVVEEETEKEN